MTVLERKGGSSDSRGKAAWLGYESDERGGIGANRGDRGGESEIVLEDDGGTEDFLCVKIKLSTASKKESETTSVEVGDTLELPGGVCCPSEGLVESVGDQSSSIPKLFPPENMWGQEFLK